MYKKKQKQQDLYLITTYSLAPNFEIFMRNGTEGGDGGEKSSNFRHFCLKLDEKTKKDVVRDDIK